MSKYPEQEAPFTLTIEAFGPLVVRCRCGAVEHRKGLGFQLEYSGPMTGKYRMLGWTDPPGWLRFSMDGDTHYLCPRCRPDFERTLAKFYFPEGIEGAKPAKIMECKDERSGSLGCEVTEFGDGTLWRCRWCLNIYTALQFHRASCEACTDKKLCPIGAPLKGENDE